MPELKRPTETTGDPVTDEAAAWLLRLRGAPDDPGLKAEFEAWLSRDARHVEAWKTARQVWSLAEIVGPAARRPTTARASGPPGRQPGRPRHLGRGRRPARAWGLGLAAAASICLAIVLFPSLKLRMQADYASAVGETRTVELADMTRVQLDSNSAIAVDYAPDRRVVTLLAGQAFFSVRPDRRRLFSVNADNVDIAVTGTEFEVRLAPADVSLAVAEGEVRVTHAREGQRESPTDAAVLVAGQGLRVQIPGGVMARLRVRPESIAAWRRGRLLIEGATIGDLIDELRRYRSGTIVITDAALAAQRVTGVFDLTDPIRALNTVVRPHAGRVREITPWLVVVSAS